MTTRKYIADLDLVTNMNYAPRVREAVITRDEPNVFDLEASPKARLARPAVAFGKRKVSK